MYYVFMLYFIQLYYIYIYTYILCMCIFFNKYFVMIYDLDVIICSKITRFFLPCEAFTRLVFELSPIEIFPILFDIHKYSIRTSWFMRFKSHCQSATCGTCRKATIFLFLSFPFLWLL